MEPTLLREVIRQRIHAGRLPRTHLIELGHGQGIGQACDACGSRIAKNQRMTVRMSAEDWRTLRFHDECFQIGDTQRNTTAVDRASRLTREFSAGGIGLG
jgi:hypothetical protein